MTEIAGKTVLITGGAQGIGLGIARAFGREGAISQHEPPSNREVTSIDAPSKKKTLGHHHTVRINELISDSANSLAILPFADRFLRRPRARHTFEEQSHALASQLTNPQETVERAC